MGLWNCAALCGTFFRQSEKSEKNFQSKFYQTMTDRQFGRERVQSQQQNYRYNSEISMRDVEQFALRCVSMQRAYDETAARLDTSYRLNDQLEARLNAALQHIDELNAEADVLHRDVQVSRNVIMNQAATFDAEREQTTKVIGDLQEQNNIMSHDLKEKTKEFEAQRQLRRAADAHIVHQTDKYNKMKERAIADSNIIAGLRAEAEKLNKQIADLNAASLVREVRLTVNDFRLFVYFF